MTIVIGLLTAVLVVVCLLIVFIVLMQRPKQEGLGSAFGGGVTDQMFGAQTTNVLQKATVYLAVMFFAITILMQVLIARKQNRLDTLGKNLTPSAASVPAAPDAGANAGLSIPATSPIEETPAPTPTEIPGTPETTSIPDATPAPAEEPASTPEPDPAPTPDDTITPPAEGDAN